MTRFIARYAGPFLVGLLIGEALIQYGYDKAKADWYFLLRSDANFRQQVLDELMEAIHAGHGYAVPPTANVNSPSTN